MEALHTVVVGGAGPTLLAVPGGPGFDHGYLRPGLDPLTDVARVVYADPRNTGRSPQAPLDEWTLEQTADDLAALELGPVFVFGHSAGGFTALHFALRHPELVRGLILASTSPAFLAIDDPAPPPSLLERAGPEVADVARKLFGGDASPETVLAFAVQVAPFYSGPAHPDVPPRVFPLSEFNNELASHFFSRVARTYDVRPRLPEIAVPALVVVGGWDWVIAPARGRVIAESLPHAELLDLPDAGHFAFIEEPEEFLPAARRLLLQ
jgi:proline iminopeptidase